MTIQATLCFILHDNRVLLLKKNPGLFGAGKWNAPGGKLQPKETAEQCATREVYEETGLEIHDPRKVGTLRWFPFEHPPFDEMWEEDRYLYRHAVEGRNFRGDFYFRGDFEKLLDHRVELL